MRALLMTTGAGPAEGRLLQDAELHGHEVDVLDVGGHRWLRRTPGLPSAPIYSWTGAPALHAAGNQIARSLRRVMAAGRYDIVLASGLGACAFASRFVEEEFVPLLWRGDLDFTAAREHATADVLRVASSVDRLFLEDEWEFDKALSKGSRAAHLLHPRPAPVALAGDGEDITPLLETPAPAPQVLLLHPERHDLDRLAAQERALRAAVTDLPSAGIDSASASSLLRARDLLADRDLRHVARTRLRGASHVVLVGSSRDHAAVADLLVDAGHADRLVIEDVLGMHDWLRLHPHVRSGRGLRLAAELRACLAGEPATGPAPHPALVREPASDLLGAYAAAMQRPVEPLHEDLAALRHDGPLEVFFATTPLEDRTDGARPLRVRAMAEAMDASAPAVRISSVPAVFARRAALVRRALDAGRPAGLLYGENSTSPIADPTVAEGLADLLGRVRAAGGRSMWFVRDLHWLDDLEGYLDDDAQREQVRSAGLRELELMAGAADALAAPSTESGMLFDDLIRRHGRGGHAWVAVPPGVEPRAVVDAADAFPAEDGVTLLYAGGVSSVYGLDLYLEAAAGLEADVRLDFVVRVGERAHLEELLERHGLADRSGVRITTVPLEWHVPLTRSVVGSVLLGSGYAALAFPFKTMSLVERSHPILCFSDMAIADLVQGEGLGTAVERDVASVRAGLQRLVAEGAPGMAAAQRAHSWGMRMAAVRAAVGLEKSD
ncbi:hypothetical protein E4A47_01665 [Micrococcus flavus]|uniref:Glycosyltransferase involved in cell wall biosynthesis n=1 Tax=Micrococcus flavus TaxID=384602 RepID=A0A4Y8X4T6_9MICC|nr:hypothetical protein [Micrococcus flavus]MBB4882949.1 glycosyltransferase involved in cell wall biosynthesis [Micrococcus flavus]TFI04375.1 hypothetical protein E4A47_01665 [Micrococcus flavus]GGK41235.1 hypothetical protein GCM10007073_05280 [Micrococcus flavus]